MSVKEQLTKDLYLAIEAIKEENKKSLDGAIGLRNVLADWYADNNHAGEETCLRYLAANGMFAYGHDGAFSWFDKANVPDTLGDPASNVPKNVYDRMEGGKVTANHKTFKTCQEAEESLLAAWLKCVVEGKDPMGNDVPVEKAE